MYLSLSDGTSLCSYVLEGALLDLYNRAPLLGMLPALLDLATAGSVSPLVASLHQSQT